MDKTSKLNERLTLIANLSVVVGIIFLAVELQQNTQAIQAQTRDSLTEKQMEFYGWLATNRDLAEVEGTAFASGLDALDPVQRRMWFGYVNAVLREWENSHYQYERGLFTAPEFETRSLAWQAVRSPAFLEVWDSRRELFAHSFRAEIDRIVAEVGG